MNSQMYNSWMHITLTVYAIYMIYKHEISQYKDVIDTKLDLEMRECPPKDQINRFSPDRLFPYEMSHNNNVFCSVSSLKSG